MAIKLCGPLFLEKITGGKWRHLGEMAGSGATSGKFREVTGELDGNKKIVWPSLS